MRNKKQVVLAAAGVAAMFAMTGCESMDTIDSTKIERDGIACPVASLPVNAVFIDIVYAADGMPSVRGPQECQVYSGTKITWRTVRGETRPFRLVFKKEHPAEDDGKRDRGRIDGDRFKYTVVTEKVTTRIAYTYGIIANGHEVDPVVIIDPPK